MKYMRWLLAAVLTSGCVHNELEDRAPRSYPSVVPPRVERAMGELGISPWAIHLGLAKIVEREGYLMTEMTARNIETERYLNEASAKIAEMQHDLRTLESNMRGTEPPQKSRRDLELHEMLRRSDRNADGIITPQERFEYVVETYGSENH